MTPIETESRNSLDVREKFLEGKTNDHKEKIVRRNTNLLKPAFVQHSQWYNEKC